MSGVFTLCKANVEDLNTRKICFVTYFWKLKIEFQPYPLLVKRNIFKEQSLSSSSYNYNNNYYCIEILPSNANKFLNKTNISDGHCSVTQACTKKSNIPVKRLEWDCIHREKFVFEKKLYWFQKIHVIDTTTILFSDDSVVKWTETFHSEVKTSWLECEKWEKNPNQCQYLFSWKTENLNLQ